MQEAVTILVLQPLAEERGAPRGGAEQEASGARIGGLPDEIADALEAEHRIEDVEGHHGYAASGVTGAGSDEARHASRLGDAFFENLPFGRFVVTEQERVVDRFVLLTL